MAGAPYRYDMFIRHYHRTNVSITDFGEVPATRLIKLHNAFPTSYKPGSDLDAVGSDVSLQELTVEIERFEVIYSDSGF